jgi:putative addiction module CopG family antidote
MQIEIGPEWEAFFNARIGEGRFRSVGEGVEEALRLLMDKEKEEEKTFNELKESLEKAARQLDRGEYIEITPSNVREHIEDIKRRGRQEFENRELSA